jgi:hypothetical protein
MWWRTRRRLEPRDAAGKMEGVANADPAARPLAVRRPRPRKARGQDRPAYLKPEDIDRVFMTLVSLMVEVSAVRDRLDTHEALAEAGAVATREAVEAYEIDAPRRAVREAARDAMLARVLRVIYEERDG